MKEPLSSTVLAALAAGAVLFASACGAGEDTAVPTLREGTVRVTTRAQSLVDVSTAEPIKLGKNVLGVSPSRAETELVAVSALMPAHGHGTRPVVIDRTADGYRVSELVLYMSGRWEVRLSLREGGRDDEALLTVDVP